MSLYWDSLTKEMVVITPKNYYPLIKDPQGRFERVRLEVVEPSLKYGIKRLTISFGIMKQALIYG